MRIFYSILINTLVASVANMTVWFALTYFVYLQTKSVMATGILSGIYLVATAFCGFWFGGLVDRHRKKNVMLLSGAVSLLSYTLSLGLYLILGNNVFTNVASGWLWVFVVLVMCGVVAGNLRGITMPTLVTILVASEKRDRANGLVGSTLGVSFLVTSVISGVLVAAAGMFWVLLLGILIMFLGMLHLTWVKIEEKEIMHVPGAGSIDIKGTLKFVLSVPGLMPLILFATINNLLGGVFMALMDAYGLSLVSVEVWGFLWGALSCGFIIGGLLVSRRGLGDNPLRTFFRANIVIWVISSLFTVQPWLWLLALGMFMYLCTVPIIEAAEQTIIQKVVPLERQGRVFGFGQSVEQLASPFTAFLIGPVTQLLVIPFMTHGFGAQSFGRWFGTGSDRGIALVFTITGFVGLLVTLFAMRTRYAKQLLVQYLKK